MHAMYSESHAIEYLPSAARAPTRERAYYSGQRDKRTDSDIAKSTERKIDYKPQILSGI